MLAFANRDLCIAMSNRRTVKISMGILELKIPIFKGLKNICLQFLIKCFNYEKGVLILKDYAFILKSFAVFLEFGRANIYENSLACQ